MATVPSALRASAHRAFHRVVRPAILAASRREGLRRTAERLPVTRHVVHRFVPGETVADAMNSVEQLRYSGRLVSIDYLGEDVTDVDTANATVNAYLALLDALGACNEPASKVRPLEVSLKLSALGQALPRDGEKIALENAHTICERAQRVGAWVTVDAEDHTTTDSTLSIVRDLRTEFDWLGTVLQAYLKRTEDDCREFAASSARIRLCKGAYDEPASVAYRASWPPFFKWLRQGAIFEIVELDVTVGDDVAFAYALLRCGKPEEFAANPDNRLRVTIGLRKNDGRWVVTHEPHSFPLTE